MLCTPATAYGGGQQYLYRILEAMKGRCNVLCVCPFFGDEALKFRDHVEQRGGTCQFLYNDRRSFALDYAAVLFSFRPNIIHINGHISLTPFLVFLLAVLKPVFGWRVCLTQHLKFASEKAERYVSKVKAKGKLRSLFNHRWAMRDHRKTKVLLKAADKIIFVNHEYKTNYESMFGLRKDQAVSIINGVDVTKFRPDLLDEEGRLGLRQELGIAESDFLVLGIGNLIIQKRFDIFIGTIASLIDEGYPVKGLIVGIGPLEEALRELAAKSNVKDALFFTGYRSDIPRLLNVGDCLLMTSDDEGLPYILLEARAAGLPAVVSAVGGNKEVVHHGVDGFLIDMEEGSRGFKGIEQLIKGTDLRNSMSRLSREDTERRFSLEHMQARTMEVFQQLGLTLR